LNYRDHILELGHKLPEYPVLFAKFANTVIGPSDPISKPVNSESLDYEAELAFVVGKRCRHVSEEQALNYVAGYMIANDISVRDYQLRTVQWLQGKTFDNSCPMGPWLVTGDEIDAANLDIVLTVNGEERQRSNTKHLVFTVPILIRYLSEIMTLEPGDVVLTGTPGGVAMGMTPPPWLKVGDIVRTQIASIGELENRIAAESDIPG
jgi:acylpyruvate hydrolase